MDDYTLPLGSAEVLVEGSHVTVVAWGAQAPSPPTAPAPPCAEATVGQDAKKGLSSLPRGGSTGGSDTWFGGTPPNILSCILFA